MPLRNIVVIDEEKCDGCGQCVTACAEGALKIIDGKAKLVSEIYCDGLGVCIGECPQDAITVEQREAEDFDEAKTKVHLVKMNTQEQAPELPLEPKADGCPGSRMQMLRPQEQRPAEPIPMQLQSRLRNWPVQLHLIPPQAPFLKGADLLLAADCVPYAFADFHGTFLDGKALAIACPKLDDTSPYSEKLAYIFANAGLKSLTIVKMEVPCCNGITQIANRALVASGADIPVREITVSIQGKIIAEKKMSKTLSDINVCIN